MRKVLYTGPRDVVRIPLRLKGESQEFTFRPWAPAQRMSDTQAEAILAMPGYMKR